MSLPAAIKRAKFAIQDNILNPGNEEKRAKAIKEIDNANTISRVGGRKYWYKELLIFPHYDLVPSSWYAETRDIQWSIEKIPEWAKSGKSEPDLGTDIRGYKYTVPPKSESR
jgi:hypothetical protein